MTINLDNDTAHSSAILDIKDNNLGILIPRIAKVNRPASPATGLLIYQTDNTPGFHYFDGSAWRVLGSSPSARTSASLGYSAEENIIAQNRSLRKAEMLILRGKSTLQNGTTFIKFDQIQENFNDLIINIQLEGDCNGLYISEKTKEGFWIKELQKGKSNVKFSWTIN